MPHTYGYPRPMVTVDTVVFSKAADTKLQVLLIKRDKPPFEGQWSFPGGFVDMDETLEAAAERELEEETGLKSIPLLQLHTFSQVDRDPRGRVISTAFFALIPQDTHPIRAADDAREVRWFPVDEVPPLAFDHPHILETALIFYKNYDLIDKHQED